MYKGEKLNSISHLVGAVLALAAMVLLIVFSSLTGDVWKIVSCTIYGFTLFLMFLMSTLYHSLKGKAKNVFRIFDHISIYLLIAGTYTPFCLVVLRPSLGWWIFGAVWGVAVFGVIFKSIMVDRFELISTLLYVLAGWTIIVDISYVLEVFPWWGLFWVAAGGVFYTVGAIFFMMDEKLPRNHEIWHFMILAASACQFVSVFYYII